MLIGLATPAHVRHRSAGFTLIELMVVISIVAISAALAAPSFTQMIANYRVRSGAESMLNGLNLARAEAVRRNSPVRFAIVVGGSGWSVSQISPSEVVQSRSNNDSPGLTVASSNSSTSVDFLPTGLVQSSGTQLTQITVSSSTTGTNTRRINIFGGGLIRMCDPGVATANDPRRC
ncbi:GspH/FimT family pseudopilin [Methylibium sp.]|uniref:GspH/FimT family pseudopilin n=1 Tax=Methylibium sp. TaxID=2067992 RepID=UPI003D0C43E0